MNNDPDRLLKMVFVILLIISMIVAIWAFPVHSSDTIEKTGDCPPGWSTSGKYCVPGKYAKYIIEKKGECPLGFRTAGKYCIKTGK